MFIFRCIEPNGVWGVYMSSGKSFKLEPLRSQQPIGDI